MEFLMFIIAICVPSLTIAYCHRTKERRIERTDVNVLQHEWAMKKLDMEHEARVLALPAPQQEPKS